MCLGINGVKMWDVYRVSRKGVCSSCTAVNSAALSVHITKLELQHVACTALDFQLQCSGCQVKGEAELHASTHTSNVAPYSSYLGFHISCPGFHIYSSELNCLNSKKVGEECEDDDWETKYDNIVGYMYSLLPTYIAHQSTLNLDNLDSPQSPEGVLLRNKQFYMRTMFCNIYLASISSCLLMIATWQ